MRLIKTMKLIKTEGAMKSIFPWKVESIGILYTSPIDDWCIMMFGQPYPYGFGPFKDSEFKPEVEFESAGFVRYWDGFAFKTKEDASHFILRWGS